MSQKVSKAQASANTRAWLEEMVIGMELCPFAKHAMDNELVRIHVVRAQSMSDWILAVYDEAVRLDQTPPEQLSNTLMVFTNGLADFQDFLDMVDMAQITLEDTKLNKVIQLAHFHPDYQFADTVVNDVSNKTNQSPYPTLHLLRVEEVTQAIAHHPDIESVPENNKEKMRQKFG